MSDRADVIVVGAGLSGMGAAYRLQTECPGRSFLILEGRVVSAHWSTEDAAWTLRTAGGEEYAGTIVHPQQWPGDLDYAGKRIVVIGSGATAVTLVPAMAETAGHVTMVQRSPTYMISLGGGDDGAGGREMSPATARLVRARNVLATSLLCQASRRWPDKVGGYLRRQVARQLPPDVPIDPHFTPRYDPWDQRLCVVPDGDLFTALRAGRASVVTGVIGARRPWKMVNNYLTDMPAMRFGRIDDGNVTFARRKA